MLSIREEHEEFELCVDDDEPDEDEFDCGFVVGEGCAMAGTEDCDFDCPWRDRLIASPYYPNCDLYGHEANDAGEE